MSEFVMGATVKLNNDFSGNMSVMTSDTEKFKTTAAGADRAIDNLDKSLQGLNGKGLSNIGTSATQAATAANGVVAPIDNIVQSTNRAQNAIQSFNRGWQNVKTLPATLSSMGSALKTNVTDGFVSARLQASVLGATVKTVAKQKFTGMVDSVKEFADTITEGQSGIKGFTNGLKNIGKISIAGTLNAVRDLTDKAKEFAKVKVSAVANQLKTLKSSFTSGKSGASGLHDALKKVASVSMSALHSGIKKVGDVANSAGTAITNGLGKALKATAKGAGIAVAAGATAISALVTSSVKAFANYEQLTGGVETLFGAGGQSLEEYASGIGKSVDDARSEYNALMTAQQTVIDNANKAYKTSGMSANDYMETVTGFSASLLQSVGGDTQKAAGIADKAIIDMADNANKMGTSMEMIQNAYQGFAKQNYTMLDNLKLGYGGTKEEMQRLLDDAGKIANTKFDISSYADVIEAIHVMQVEMGMSGLTAEEAARAVASGTMTEAEAFAAMGTTAKEAATTISGSAASMKAAWGNMLVSLTTGGENFDICLDNLVNSAVTFGKNLLPAVTGALTGIGSMIEKLAPMIAKELPGLITTILPPLISATTQLVAGLIKALPGILGALYNALPDILRTLGTAVAEAFGDQCPLIASLGTAISKLAGPLTKAIPAILGFVVAVKGFNAIKSAVGTVSSFASSVGQIANKVTGGVGEKLSGVADGMSKTGESAKTNSTNMLAAAKSFMMMGAGVLMVSAGFAILAFSSISLASAGGAAIGVMLGMVVALAAVGFGMAALLKTVSSLGPSATQGATAMLIMGVAVLLVAAGFAILTQASIALASSGGMAIGVMVGMVAAIALLAIGAAALAPVLTTGAVGLLAFGAAIVLCGVGAVLLAASIAIIASTLPIVATYGISAATAFAALGVGMAAFAAGAALAGVASVTLGAGLVVLAAGLTAVLVPFTLLTAVMTPFSALVVVLAASMKVIGTAFKNLASSVPVVSKSMGPLAGQFTKLTIPSGLLAAAIAPLTVEFVAFAAAAALALASTTGLAAVTTVLCTQFMLIMAISALLPTTLETLGTAMVSLAGQMPTLNAALVTMGAQLMTTAPVFMLFAQTALSAVTSGMASISAALTGLNVGVVVAKCKLMAQAFTVGMAGAKKAVTSGITAIQTILGSVNLYSTGVNIMQGLNNGLMTMRGAIIATAQNIANSVKTTINSALDIHSPSRVLEESGENTGLGFVGGLLKMLKLVEGTSTQLADAAVEPFSAKNTTTDIAASGTVASSDKTLGGLRIAIEKLILNDVGNKDTKQLVADLLKELYAQLGGDDELLGNVDFGVLL